MSVEAMSLVLHHSRASGNAKLVLLGIANHEGDGGAWPTVETLAKYAGLTGKREHQLRTVRRLLGQLCQLGELDRNVNEGGTSDRDWWARPNLYRVLVTCPPSCDRSAQHRTLPEAVDNPPTHPRVAQPGGGSTTRGGRAVEPGDPRVAQPGKPSIEPTTRAHVSAQGDSQREPDAAAAVDNDGAAPAVDLDAVRARLHAATLDHQQRDQRAKGWT